MIDAGGYIGTTAILYAQLYPQTKVICIEPLPENCNLIKKNIENNGLKDRIILIEKALFNTNGEKVDIYYRDDSPVGIAHKFVGSSSLVYTESVSARFFSAETISLAKIFSDYNIPAVRILKMDLECSEYKALEGVPGDVLKKIQTIKGEYHNPDKTKSQTPRTDLFNLVREYFDDRSKDPETPFIGAFEFERKT
jgi:FkbM family methyltransferase